MIRWEKQGRIFVPDGRTPWMRTHAQVPVADRLDEARLRIYFAGRDERNRARIGWIDVDPDDPSRLLALANEPVLPLGERGTFDDNGMMPSCIVSMGRRKYMFYLGWNPQVTVSYRVAIGLAVSEDGGGTYHRYSSGPILDRDLNEPYFCSTPCVLQADGRWHMWYLSCTGWDEVHGHPEPMYHVKYADSHDGIHWRRDGIICIDGDESAQAIARPWVMSLADRYAMWVSCRGLVGYRTDPQTGYRLRYAESTDGVHWAWQPDPAGLDRSTEGWDSVMVAYANVIRVSDRVLCFYNGNDFGKSGLGYAVGRDQGSPSGRWVA